MRSDPERSDLVADWRAAVAGRVSVEQMPRYGDIESVPTWSREIKAPTPITVESLIHPYLRSKYVTYQPGRPIGEI